MYGTRARIGYAAPPFVTEVFCYEFYQMAPADVTLMITTLEITTRSPAEVAASHERSVRAARAMADAGADIVLFGGNPINLTLGIDRLGDFIRDMENDIGTRVATSTTAQIAALKALGATKISVAHPYETLHNARNLASIEKFGFAPGAVRAADYGFMDLGRVPKDTAMKLARELMEECPDADCLHFASAHWAVAHAIDDIEREFGVPVMTSQQAIVWHAFRRTGIAEPIGGYGRLLRDF